MTAAIVVLIAGALLSGLNVLLLMREPSRAVVLAVVIGDTFGTLTAVALMLAFDKDPLASIAVGVFAGAMLGFVVISQMRLVRRMTARQ